MADGGVLVLNRSWVAIHVASVRRALSMLYQGIAQAVHPFDYSLYDFNNWCELSQSRLDGHFIHTPSIRIRIPEVILLTTFNGFVYHEVRFSRRNIFERDRNTCQYCGKRFSKCDLTLDHVIPRSRGGCDSWENLALACVRCNIRKGSRTPEEAAMPLLRPPGKPVWLPKLGARIPKNQIMNWQRFVDSAYWDVELRE
jgi:5-methylcytosine-specific restriction endonuclease McrA